MKDTNFKEGALFIDFQTKYLKSLKLNGKEVNISESFKDQRILLPKESVSKGSNTVELEFHNLYKNTGTGLHKFVDPQDKGEYLYTQFEPFHAHRAIPCFDQPNIKGSMTLSTVVPSDHVSLSNSYESSEHTNEEDPAFCRTFVEENGFQNFLDELGPHKVTKFGKTPKISSYLFAIISGPYDIVEKESEIPGRDKPIRMRFMCRKSIKRYISQAYEDMYEAVVTGIKWYSDFFGINFQWDKYDQIFCPEFKYGAMENVGAVTFTENYIPFGEFTEVHLTRLQNTTLHELCHQWFGNLCTMEWWNDLWLNEAFATYMAYLCTAENDNLFKKTPGMWITLNSRKNMASNSDTLSTTHPIKKDAATTDSADDMVNAITYGKGSAFIKQVIHMISKEAMSKGCHLYFKKHAWTNTTLDDFIDALSKGCQETNQDLEVDLKKYCVDFLTTKGINSVKAEVEDKEDGIAITFKQTQGRYSDSINAQKMDYHLYDQDMNMEEHSIILNADNKPQIVEHSGRKAENTFVLLNGNDEAYILTELDDEFVQKFIKGDLHKIKGNINRIVVWRTLISMVKNLKLKSTEFFAIVLNNIFKEDDIILLTTILTTVKMFINSYIPEEQYEELCRQMFDKLYQRYDEISTTNPELKKVVKSSLFYYLAYDEHIEQASKWLENNEMELEAEDKEAILLAVYRSKNFDKDTKNKMLKDYQGGDQSDRAQRFKITCAAALPDKENKARVWDIITHPKEKELSSYEYRAYLNGFYARTQKDLTEEYVGKYLEELPKFAKSGEKDHMTIFTGGAFPPSYHITDEFLGKVKKIANDFEAEDKVKYDSFLRVLKSLHESKVTQKEIRDAAAPE